MSKQSSFKSDDKKQISFYWSKSKYESFRVKYPNLTTLFLTRCMERAVNDSKFFDSVFFSSVSDGSF